MSRGVDRDIPAMEAVTVGSFHRAKGLEWPAVWVTGLEQGLVPIGYATATPAGEEERRLLYVALTRAERELHCSWAEARQLGGRLVPREPSPWLDAVASTIDPSVEWPPPATPSPGGSGWSPSGSGCGGAGGHRVSAPPSGQPEPDPAVVESLRALASPCRPGRQRPRLGPAPRPHPLGPGCRPADDDRGPAGRPRHGRGQGVPLWRRPARRRGRPPHPGLGFPLASSV